MTNLKQLAEEYVPSTTKNIADLEVVNVDIEVVEKTFKEGTDDAFTILVTTINGEDYRVPKTVIRSLNSILQKKPDLKQFAVAKSGQGMDTDYTVIPL